tara:strand:- start:3057 stop:4076 length:1020 start_codon:yes stop_codon:yes gene_type:complete
MKETLTLIAPLLDRHELTDRSLRWLQEQGCECKIILADGSKTPFSGSYEGLNIDYFYNGFDKNIAQYMNKMNTAMQMVETPSCMIFDNDDAVNLTGVLNGSYFLSKHKEYSSYQNDVRPLELYPEINVKDSLYTEKSIEQELPTDRLLDVISNFNSFNYAVFRTSITKCFFEIMDALKNDDFQLFQKSWAYTSAVLGKCKRLQNQSYYYFIPGNSILQTGGKVHKFSNWASTQYWNESCPKMVSMISCLYKSVYQWDWDDIRQIFLRAFLDEICKKNNIEPASEEYIDGVIKASHDYDDTVGKVVDKYYKLFTFESWDFECKQYCPVGHLSFMEDVING